MINKPEVERIVLLVLHYSLQAHSGTLYSNISATYKQYTAEIVCPVSVTYSIHSRVLTSTCGHPSCRYSQAVWGFLLEKALNDHPTGPPSPHCSSARRRTGSS